MYCSYDRELLCVKYNINFLLIILFAQDNVILMEVQLGGRNVYSCR